MKNYSLLIAILTIPGLALAAPDVPRESRVVTGQHAVVATDSEFASPAGLEILQAGGNALDAAVAVSSALAVTSPYRTGMGGRALSPRTFRVLGELHTRPAPPGRSELGTAVPRALGEEGMVGGQRLDLKAENANLGMAEVTRLQRMKTGMLIAFACESAAILGKAPEPARHALHAFVHDLGLAFQIVDDLLDVEGDEKELGKKTGKDAAAGKATFVSLMGRDRARAQAEMLSGQATQHLEMFAEKADPLRELARFIVRRRS